MKAKVIIVEGEKNIESAVNKFLTDNPNIEVKAMSQSSSWVSHRADEGFGPDYWCFVITIIYQEGK